MIAAAARRRGARGRLRRTTDEGRRIEVIHERSRVTRVTTTVEDYECERVRRLGPLRVSVTPRARGSTAAAASRSSPGKRAERIGVAGT